MNLSIEDITVECQDLKKCIYLIQIKTPDSKILIGIHGQTLEITKHLLSRILEKQIQIPILIHLEVNDYLRSKDEKFYRYLDGRISYAQRSWEDVILSNLSSYDRKKAHGYISDKKNDNLKTFSTGEGKDRELHLVYTTQEASWVWKHAIPNTTKKIDLIDDDGIGI